MKTLNINKLTILFGLFLISVFFTTSANALCVVNGDGAIVIAADSDGNSETPVKDDTGNEDVAANTATTDCLITVSYTHLTLPTKRIV